VADLLIRISGDSQNFKKALEDVEGQTGALSDDLANVAKVSAVAFAALTAEVIVSSKALAVEQRALEEVNQALQNQGIYTEDLAGKYRKWAEAIETKTGVDGDAISSSQALMQSLIGQTQITEEATKAIVDFSVAKKVDLAQAFELIGKGVAGNVAMLKRYGIEVSSTGTREERLAEITEKLTQRFGGQAEAATKQLGVYKLVEAQFGNLQKAIASRFAPALEALGQKLASVLGFIQENPALIDFGVAVGAAVAVVSGLGVVLGTAGYALLQVRAAMIAVKGLVGATGIGLLVILATELYLNWSTVFPRMQAIFRGFAEAVTGSAEALGMVLQGALLFRPDMIKAGLTKFKDSLSKGLEEATRDLPQIKAPTIDQDGAKAEAAAAAESEMRELERIRMEGLRAQNDLIRLETEGASEALIALKREEIEIYKALEDEKYEAVKETLVAKLDEIRFLQNDALRQELEARRVFQEELLLQNEEYQALSDEQKAVFRMTEQETLQEQLLTMEQIEIQAAAARSQRQISEQNTYLENTRKFGKAYAEIYRIMNSEVLKGMGSAFDDLEQMQTSSSATLKGIGKAAAIANIIMKTSESAMNIYAGFSTIPFVGHALGIAGAAAAVAFGGEQIGRVTKAADGGLLRGGIPGVDSIPVLAQENELVSPAQSFEEVIGSVRAMREAQKMGLSASSGGELGEGGLVHVVLEAKESLAEWVEARIVERRRLGISMLPATV
jgi:hypothetical protein